MILRIWSAVLNPERLEEYRRYERERYLSMLHKQPGFLGVLFLREAHGAASITIWDDLGAVEALGSSPSYQETTRYLTRSGLLTGDPSVEVFEVESEDLRPDALLRALGA